MEPPAGFVDLSTAYNATKDTFVNIIGVVVDLMPPTLTRTGEHMMTFKLLDPRLRDSVYGSRGLAVRFFRKDIQHLPRISERGDVVLLRNAKTSTFNQQPMALSNLQTSPLVFPHASIPAPNYQITYHDKRRVECLGVPQDKERLSLAEQKYVIQLKQDMGTLIDSLPQTPKNAPTGPAAMKRPGEELPLPEPKKQRPPSTFGRKFRLVHELRHMEFADICGQVVKKFTTQFGSCELYITDYTENKDMFFYAPPESESDPERDGDQFGYSGPPKKAWPGPWGFLVLKINAKDPHAYYANRAIDEGDVILLKNVKMKIMSDKAKLEGDMWPDNDNPERVQIMKLKDLESPEVQALIQRKERYWAARNAKAVAKQQQIEKTKPTKSERKKQRKAARDAVIAKHDKVQNGEPKANLRDEVTYVQSKKDLNPYIRCGHEEVPVSTVNNILDPENKRHTNTMPDGETYALPFVNAKFRARVRVVDFAPKQLEDFAVAEQLHDGEKSDDSVMIDWESSLKHEWSFSLSLLDATKPNDRDGNAGSIWATVGHEEAQYLFGNNIEDPRDLKNDHRLLTKLREKLCILWGNLEEKAADTAISNRPFECCLQEYGIEMDDDDSNKQCDGFGFKRMYRMFGTTIL